jgi:hypothetical protein
MSRGSLIARHIEHWRQKVDQCRDVFVGNTPQPVMLDLTIVVSQDMRSLQNWISHMQSSAGGR